MYVVIVFDYVIIIYVIIVFHTSIPKTHGKVTTKTEHLQTSPAFSVIGVLIPWIAVILSDSFLVGYYIIACLLSSLGGVRGGLVYVVSASCLSCAYLAPLSCLFRDLRIG